jgi:hypothetical protein
MPLERDPVQGDLSGFTDAATRTAWVGSGDLRTIAIAVSWRGPVRRARRIRTMSFSRRCCIGRRGTSAASSRVENRQARLARNSRLAGGVRRIQQPSRGHPRQRAHRIEVEIDIGHLAPPSSVRCGGTAGIGERIRSGRTPAYATATERAHLFRHAPRASKALVCTIPHRVSAGGGRTKLGRRCQSSADSSTSASKQLWSPVWQAPPTWSTSSSTASPSQSKRTECTCWV